MATENIPFLYGELNQTTEYLRYGFESSHLNIVENDNKVNLSLNADSSVIIKKLPIELDSYGNQIQNYGLFLYNPDTEDFDIQLGELIKIGAIEGSSSTIKTAKIGDTIIPASVNEEGQLVLEFIPVNAIKDVSTESNYTFNEETQEWEYYESVIDGNISLNSEVTE